MRVPEFVKRAKRYLVNAKLHWSGVRSYGQHGEDDVVLKLLEESSIAPSGSTDYIDVGANQPAAISNTYGLYRRGYRGLLVEPNRDLYGLLRSFRPEDRILPVGCSDRAGVASFNSGESSVLGFLARPSNAKSLVPVLTLDRIAESLEIEAIALLSIDVEGMNYQVLEGACKLLERTQIVIIEADNDAERDKMLATLQRAGHYKVQELGCNLITKRVGKSS